VEILKRDLKNCGFNRKRDFTNCGLKGKFGNEILKIVCFKGKCGIEILKI
jgi:hypothetical protein